MIAQRKSHAKKLHVRRRANLAQRKSRLHDCSYFYKAKSKFRKLELVVAQSRTETRRFAGTGTEKEPCEKVACTKTEQYRTQSLQDRRASGRTEQEDISQRTSQLEDRADKSHAKISHRQRANCRVAAEKEDILHRK